jgi:hypothetical protein
VSARAAPALAVAALLGIGAAPAAAAAGGSGRFVEICTAHGSAWIELPQPDEEGPVRKRDGAAAGCAHALCPRGKGPERKKAAPGA